MTTTNGQTIYTCPMHPEVESTEPGSCPKCGMFLVPREETGTEASAQDDDAGHECCGGGGHHHHHHAESADQGEGGCCGGHGHHHNEARKSAGESTGCCCS